MTDTFSDLKQTNKPVLLTLFQTLFNRILLTLCDYKYNLNSAVPVYINYTNASER